MTEQTKPSTAESLQSQLSAWINELDHCTQAHEAALRALIGKIEEAAYTRGIRSNERLMQETIDQGEFQRTSIIRATVAAVMEAFNLANHGAPLDVFSITMSIEAQRTIWDRVELTTERDASQENVTFTIHKK